MIQSWQPPFILMVDRGDCTFVQKVRNGQHAGASAVIIADDVCICSHPQCDAILINQLRCRDKAPKLIDDGSAGDITIPSILMFKEDVDAIKETLVQTQENIVILSISLELPQETLVNYTVWTTPTTSVEFFRNFRSTATSLYEQTGGAAFFTPRMFIYDGTKAGCRDNHGGCSSLCTNMGRYCSTDPDNDLDTGISGADNVRESLRRTCIWNRYGSKDGLGSAWWDYVIEFDRTCATQGLTGFTNDECVTRCMEMAGIPSSEIERCMKDSGGLEGDVTNSLLERLLDQETYIVKLPALDVNGIPVRGSLTIDNVLEAVCVSLTDAARPKVCQRVKDRMPGTSGGTGRAGSSSKPSPHRTVSVSTWIMSLFLLTLLFVAALYVHRSYEQQRRSTLVRDIVAEYMPLSSE
jgi:hypothetical protein